jgi:hypothetical protein
MKRFLLSAFVFLFAALSLNAQGGFGLPSGFDLKQFQKNEELALWLIQYDSTIQRVNQFDRNTTGKDFICYQDKKGWKVAAGKLDSLGLKNITWFSIDAKKTVTPMKKPGDTVLVGSMARSLFNATKLHAKLKFSDVPWRKYVKQNIDLTFTVYMFCDKDASGNIWYGPECMWWFSSNGNNLVTTKVTNKAPMMASTSGKTLNISCPTEKMPSLGAVWLSYRIMAQNPEIAVSYKTGTSTLNYNTAEKTYSWQHEGK